MLVIGAGPAGLTAAQTMALRGFDVELFEKNERAGGQVITASACHLQEKLYWCIEDLLTAVRKAGVKIYLGRELSAGEIASMSPYAVIIATGGIPLKPRSISGLDREKVYTAPEIILGEKTIENSRVAVIGSGMTGLETAEILCSQGNKVTVVEMAPEIAPGTWFQLVDDVMSRISPYGAEIRTGTKLVSVEEGKIITQDAKTGKNSEIETDYVVLSLGVRPADGLANELEGLGLKNVYRAGDALGSGTIADACHSAYDTSMSIK